MDETTTIDIGDQVTLVEQRGFSGQSELVYATVVDVRVIMGKQTYVIEIEGGKRKVVGPNQIRRTEAR